MDPVLLTKDDIPSIIKLKKLELIRNYEIYTPKFLADLTDYLNQELGHNIIIYGIKLQKELVAVLGFNILHKSTETVAKITIMFTLPSLRNRHLQTMELIPAVASHIASLGIDTIEAENTCSNKLLANHLFGEILALSPDIPVYKHQGDIQPINSFFHFASEKISQSSYMYGLVNDEGNLILSAVADTNQIMPTANHQSGEETTISLFHYQIPSNQNIAFSETEFLSDILHHLAGLGRTNITLWGVNISSETLTKLGFTQDLSIMRGNCIKYVKDKEQIFHY